MAGAQRSVQYTRLTVEDGLSNNSVQCILQDKSSIVWIGTNGGLNRYDGSTFIQYSILTKPSLSNNVVTALMEDEKGFIWIGTENGLNILDPFTNTIQQFIHQDSLAVSLPQGPVRAIQKWSNGHICVVGETWLVDFSNRDHFIKVAMENALVQKDEVFTSITESSDEMVWLSYLDQPTVLVPQHWTEDQQFMGEPVYVATDYLKVYNDNQRNTWGISSYGIFKYNNDITGFKEWIKNPFAVTGPNLHLHAYYCIDADGSIWLANDRGSMVRYDLQKRQVTDYSWLLKDVNVSIVYCLYKDSNNTIWVGTDNGIIKLSNREAVFASISFRLQGNELRNIHCRRIMSDKNNNLYAATENYGLLKKTVTNAGNDTTIALSTFGTTAVSKLPVINNKINAPLNGHYDIGYIYDMWYDGKDFLWLAGFGIGRVNLKTDSLTIFLAKGDNDERENSINQFSIAYDGKKFWTSGQHNLYTFDPATEEMLPFRDNNGNMPFKDLPCWSLLVTGEWLWAGSVNGLYKVNVWTKQVLKVPIHYVLDFGINDLASDGGSNIWISTAGGGLIWYNDVTHQLKQFTNNDGLSNNTVCGVLKDGRDNLWISTYAGLSYFNRETGQFTNFYAKDGINADEFNRKAFYKLKDGRMIFGGLNGYMRFNPSTVFKTIEPVTISLTRFSKINSSGNTVDSIFNLKAFNNAVIEPADKFFSFHFMLSDQYDPAGDRFFYQMQGLDNAWHSIGNQHFVSFNGLSPGRYTLKIKGNTGKGSDSVNELSINILVRQVFYRTTWFILLVLAVLASIGWFIIKYRIRHVKKIQGLRTRIASDLHDDVGSSLVRITVLADAIRRDGSAFNVNEQLGAISGISRGAISTMKDVVWSIDSRNDTMGGMIQYMQEHLYNMLTHANIDFELKHSGFSEQEKLSMEFRQNVYLTFKEAISNIVKHSGATRVEVDLKKEKGLFTMAIKDDGKGFPEKKSNGGNGLYNMQLRAQRLNANIQIVSARGVAVIMKVPI
jgi:ligand-binding sensor domain-containing protein